MFPPNSVIESLFCVAIWFSLFILSLFCEGSANSEMINKDSSLRSE